MILSMPKKPIAKPDKPGPSFINVHSTLSPEDLAAVDAAASAVKPRPISRSLMIATIINNWAEQQRASQQAKAGK